MLPKFASCFATPGTVFHVRKHPAAIISDVATNQNCPLYILQELCHASVGIEMLVN